MSRHLISEQPLRNDLEDLEILDFLKNMQGQPTKENASLTKANTSTNEAKVEKLEQLEKIEKDQSSIKMDKKTRYHQLQVLDEDAENFKIKLDNLLNTFRSDTLSEFMSIKRSLLEEQTATIENETKRYSKLLEQKTNELDKTKEALALKIKSQERAEVIMNVMAGWVGTARKKKRENRLISKCFNGMKVFKRYMEFKHKIEKIAKIHHKKNTQRTFLNIWKDIHTQSKENKMQKEHEETLNKELDELAAKYNKEIDTLTFKLNEANKLVEEANKNKIDIQENLKKAFMRGVCALNFEAMNILQPSAKTGNIEENAVEKLLATTNNISTKVADMGITMSMKEFNPLIINPVDDINNNTGTFQNLNGYSSSNQQINQLDLSNQEIRERSPKKNVVFYQAPRPESKEIRWKEAPIVGSSFVNMKREIEKPIIQEYYNKENDEQYVSSSNEVKTSTYSEPENEGKVIKVNNGKSYVASATTSSKDISKKPQTNTNSIGAKDIKASKIEEKVSINAGKSTNGLKSQIDKSKKK